MAGTVIKAGQTGTLWRRLSTVDLADHLAEARSIIERGRRSAAKVLGDARRERNRLLGEARQTGYEAGHEEGHRAGLAAGQEAAFAEAQRRFAEQQAAVLADLRRVVDEIDRMKVDLRIAAERHLLEFAVGLAQKLTFAVGLEYRESAVENLRRAMELIGAKTDVAVRAHPDDITALSRFADTARGVLDRAAAIHLVPDEHVAPGGCVVRTEATEVDARLETQMGEIVELLLGEGARDA